MCWTHDSSKIISEFVESDNITRWDQKEKCPWVWRGVWRYQRDNQNPYIEEEQTTQCCPVFRGGITDFHFELVFLIENKTNAKYWSRLNKYFLLVLFMFIIEDSKYDCEFQSSTNVPFVVITIRTVPRWWFTTGF